MTETLLRFYKRIIIVLSLPIILETYFKANTGKDYGVGLSAKISLLFKIIRNSYKIDSASDFLEHLAMATKILNIPKSAPGCLVECGSFKGGSTANLSLLASLTNRTLEIFDSFSGLPKPGKTDKKHLLIDLGEIHTYSKGSWKATQTEVKNNILRYGKITACHFNPGYFNKTLPNFKEKCVFIFLDVDLRSSMEVCLKHLWNQLDNNCYLFSHEATHLEIASLFFDQKWWRNNLNCRSPGLIGAGSGLGLSPATDAFKSQLGYTVKNPKYINFTIRKQTGRQ